MTEKKKVRPLTRSDLEQLLTYCKMMEIEGHYYGSKPTWDSRNERIKEWVKANLEKMNERL